MSYCQDCGAHNEAGRIDCRICGRPLERERGATPCSICHRPLGLEATFCSECGAPVPLGVGAGAGRGPSLPTAGGAHSPAGLGSDLNLPDWLRQAAATTPEADAAEPIPIDALLPPGFVVTGVAQPAAPAANGAAAHGAGEDHPATPRRLDLGPPPQPADTLVAPPLPPLPDGGLAAAMPAWLQAPPVDVPAPRQAVAEPRDLLVAPRPAPTDTTLDPRLAASLQAPAAPPTAAAAADAGSPVSFIGENDLPSWIRDLVAKEEAEAEEARLAAEAAALAAGEAEAAARVQVNATGPLADRARVIGGMHAGGTRPRSWLDRGDRPADAALETFGALPEAVDGRSTIFADVVDRRATAMGTDRLKLRPELMQPDQPAAAPQPGVAAPAPAAPTPAAAEPSPAADRSLPLSPMRLALVAAIVIALLVLVVKMFVL